MKFTVIIESDDDGGYVAHCPAIKGCWSQGESIDETLENIREAIIGCLKTLNNRAAKMYGKNTGVTITQVAVA